MHENVCEEPKNNTLSMCEAGPYENNSTWTQAS